MSKFSVKKPLTVFVAVIAILVLGVVAYTKMTPDLLPNMDFPYVMVMTTYPGASPEKVEQEITKPLEQSMSTLEHIQEVRSTSSENVSMVILQFDDDVNMDTIGVDIQQKITSLSALWDDMVGSPYVLKINPSMLPVEVAALSMEGMNTMELTDFLNDTLMNELEGMRVERDPEVGVGAANLDAPVPLHRQRLGVGRLGRLDPQGAALERMGPLRERALLGRQDARAIRSGYRELYGRLCLRRARSRASQG